MAAEPSRGTKRVAKTPWNVPVGVRRADRMTTESALMGVLGWAAWLRYVENPMDAIVVHKLYSQALIMVMLNLLK